MKREKNVHVAYKNRSLTNSPLCVVRTKKPTLCVHQHGVLPFFKTALLLCSLLICVTACKTTEKEEVATQATPLEQKSQESKQIRLKTDLPAKNWSIPSSLADLRGTWTFSDGSGYEYPAVLQDGTYFSYHSQPLNRTEYWANIATEYGMTFEELWEARGTVQFADERGNTFPIVDETGTHYVLRIRRDKGTGDVYFQYWYYVPEAVAARNLSFFRLSPSKNQFYEEGRFVFRGTKINPLQEGPQIYQKR